MKYPSRIDLNENVSHRLGYLNIWSPDGDAVCGGLGEAPS